MKYIDAEKLKAEIVKLKNGLISLMNKIYYAANYNEWKAKLNGYNKILSIIGSLQQEQQKVDIEKEINSFVQGWNIDEFLGLVNDEGRSVTVGDIKNIARHFYELGLNAKKEE